MAVVAGHRTEHLLAVIQADRQRRVIQTGGRDTRDGRGVVRTRHADPAGLVDDLEHLILIQLGVCLRKTSKYSTAGVMISLYPRSSSASRTAFSGLPQCAAGGKQKIPVPSG